MALGWDGPKRDEARATAPETPRHHSRKNKRRWCRGKVGVEHAPELQVSKSSLYVLAKTTPDNEWHQKHMTCHWSERQRWEWLDGRIHWTGTGEFTWFCRHEYWCANCGKILGKVGRECPEFHPHERDWKK